MMINTIKMKITFFKNQYIINKIKEDLNKTVIRPYLIAITIAMER